MSRHACVVNAVRVALGIGAMVLGSAAIAADEGELEEIVVTAQFREQSAQDIPLAITAISADLLEARSQTNIAQVADQAPGVMLRQAAPMYGPSIQAFVRGIGQFDFNPALEPGVGLYVDDVYYATLTGSMLDLLDLERVEVLRGPQGTLAGKNSIGGSVKLYSEHPRSDTSGLFSATYGSRDRVDLRGMANFALADNLFMRVSGVDKRQGGYIDRIDYGCAFPASGIRPLRSAMRSCVVARDSDINYSGLRAALRLVASDDLEFNLAVDYTDDVRNPTGSVLLDANTIPNANLQPGTPTNLPLSTFVVPYGSYYTYASYYNGPNAWVGNLPVIGGSLNGVTLGVTPAYTPYILKETRPEPKQFFKGGGTSLGADWQISKALAMKSITAWRWYDSGFVNDNDLSPLTSMVGDGTLPFHSASQELRFSGQLADNKVDWTLGGFYMRQASRYQSWQDLRYNGQANSYVLANVGASADAKRNPLQFQQNDPTRANTKAAFAHASWRITDQLATNLGLRYTDERKTYTFVRKNEDGTPQTFLAALDDYSPPPYSGDRLDYRINFQYDWSAVLMTYVQYATGFKGGGISPRPFVAAQAVTFKPETLDNYEVGVKTDLLDRHLRLNASVYYGKYSDIQMPLQSCPQFGAGVPCGAWANAGDGKVKGAELEAILRPVTGLRIDASYTWFDFKYTFVDPAVSTATPRPWHITKDDTLPFAPKSKWALGAQYDIPLANGSSIAPRVDMNHQASFHTNPANQPANFVGAYSLLNARLTWRNSDQTLDVALEGTNLTDKYYFTSRNDQLQAAGSTDGVPGRPREWALTFKKRF
jgi:iron complex outermembrane recepter protein